MTHVISFSMENSCVFTHLFAFSWEEYILTLCMWKLRVFAPTFVLIRTVGRRSFETSVDARLWHDAFTNSLAVKRVPVGQREPFGQRSPVRETRACQLSAALPNNANSPRMGSQYEFLNITLPFWSKCLWFITEGRTAGARTK